MSSLVELKQLVPPGELLDVPRQPPRAEPLEDVSVALELVGVRAGGIAAGEPGRTRDGGARGLGRVLDLARPVGDEGGDRAVAAPVVPGAARVRVLAAIEGENGEALLVVLDIADAGRWGPRVARGRSMVVPSYGSTSSRGYAIARHGHIESEWRRRQCPTGRR